MNYNEKVLNILKTKFAQSGFTDRQVMKALNYNTPFEKTQAMSALEHLENHADIYFDKKLKKYFISQQDSAVTGVVNGNAKGFAFIVLENQPADDIFIAPQNLNGALHGDTVSVKLLTKSGKLSDEGKVISIIKRGFDMVVGTISMSKGFAFLIADDRRISTDFFIAKENCLNAKNGDKVVAKVIAYQDKKRHNPEAKVLEILGAKNDAGVDVLSIIRSHGLYEEFDRAVLEAAKKAPQSIIEKDKKGREDLTGEIIITIDGEDAKDLDDAISLTKTEDGLYRLGVHIADVSHYVKQNSLLDKEAYKRGTSVYFPDRVLPMLPRELSNGICSLNPKVERLTLSVFMDIDKNGKVVDSRIVESFIKTTERMTYTSVTKILNGDEQEIERYKKVVPLIKECKNLAEIISDKRKQRGSIDFDLPEAKIEVDEKGNVVKIAKYPREISNRIIEEFMILTNETVAFTVEMADLPFIYRVHEEPSDEKMTNFRDFLNGFGIKLRVAGGVNPREFVDLLEKIEGLPIFGIINKVMLRTMMKAKYSPINIGHFGIASKNYSHFTSPIRRYPDLVIHRIIKQMINGEIDGAKYDSIEKFVNAASVQSSEREKLAEEAEREVDDYFKAKYMSGKIGEEFSGILSGVTEFGIFVQLENTVEGMVRLQDLPDDNYTFFKNRYLLKGTKRSFGLGDKVNIRVESVNLSAKKIDFSLVEVEPIDISSEVGA